MSTNRDSIRIKRGMSAELPESLPLGELAFCIDTRELWVGSGDGLPLKRVTNTEITQHLEEWNLLYTEVNERFETKYHDVSSQFAEKFLDLSEQFSDKYQDLNKQFSDKFEEICVQFSTKYDNLEEHYAKDLSANKLLSQANKESIDLLKRDIGTTENIEDLREINNQATETLEQLNAVKEELQNDVLVIKDIEKDLQKASVDYSGEHHENLKDSMDANVDFILGEFNSTNMTGEHITAHNTIQRHIKNAELKGHTEVNYIKDPSDKDLVMPYPFDDAQSIKLSDTKDTGSLNIVLKGNTEVNVLKNPMRDYVVPYEFEEGYTATLTDTKETGSIQSAILKGQTLVNLQPKGSSWAGNTNVMWYNKSIPNSLFKPNTKYFLKFNSDLSNILKSCYLGACRPVANHKIYPSVSGCYAIMTTSEAPDGGLLHVYPKSGIELNSTILNENVRFIFTEYQDGMENWDIPYFEGMTSVKAPVLHSVGKNLFDIKTMSNRNGWHCDKTVMDDGRVKLVVNNTDGVAYWQTDEFPVEVGKTYSISTPAEGSISYCVIWANDNKTKTYTSPITITPDIKTISIGVYMNNSTMGNTGYCKIQIEEGSAPTPYEPYKSNTLSTPEDLELRGIGNVKDELNVATGELTQRIGEVVLDGSNTKWTIHNNSNENSTFFISQGLAELSNNNGNILSGTSMCDTMALPKNVPELTKLDGFEGVCVETAFPQVVYLRIKNSKLSSVDSNGLNNYLQTNPVIIQYKLATPTIKTVDLSILDQDGLSVPALSTYNEVTYINTTVPENSLKPLISSKTPEFPVMIKPNTKYSIVADTTTNGFDEIPLTYNLGGAEVETSVGEKLTVIQTPSTLENETFKVTGTGMKLSNVMILEKDLTGKEIPNYTEGMQSVKMSVLKTTGKNLFDKSKVNYNTTTNANTGIQTGSSNYVTTDYIEVSSNERYVSNNLGVINFYDSSKNFISIINSPTLPKTFITPSNCKYIRVRNYSLLPSLEEQQNVIETLQIEQGTQATSYEPYQTNILTVNEPVELRGVGDVKDTLDLMTGEVVERVGEITFSGENGYWNFNTPQAEHSKPSVRFTFSKPILRGASTPNRAVQSDKIPTLSWDSSTDNEIYGIAGLSGELLYMYIPRSYIGLDINDNDITSANSKIKEYFDKMGDVTVQYPLETESIKTVDFTITNQNGAKVTKLSTFNDVTYISTTVAEGALNPIISHKDLEYEVLLKPNTKYSIITNPISNGHPNSPISFDLGGQQVETTVGSYCTLVTTPNSLTHEKLIFSEGVGHKLQGGVMVLEGDKTGMTFSHFDGMKSVENPTVRVNNKNLFNPSTVRYSHVFNVNGEIMNNSNYVTSELFRVKPGCRYYVNDAMPVVCGYDLNSNQVALIRNVSFSGEFITPTNCHYIRIRNFNLCPNQTEQESIVSQAYLAEVGDSTGFIPHQSNSLPLTIPMRSLSNGTCDTLNLLTGEYVQNVGEIVIDGTENWNKHTVAVQQGDIVRWQIPLPNSMPNAHSWCDKMISYSNGDRYNTDYVRCSTNILWIYQADTTLTREQFIGKLQSISPITIQYELAEPIVTKLDLQWEDGKLFAYDGTTHFFVDVEGGHLQPILDVDVPVNIVAELSRLRAEKEQLETSKAQLENQLEVITYRNTNLQSNLDSLVAENQDLKLQTYDLQTRSNVLQLKNKEMTKHQEKLQAENLELQKRASELAQTTMNLTEELHVVDSVRETGDLELLSSDFELDFRLMEIEFALDIPMTFSAKGVNSMARTPYEMAKTLILGGKYEREDMEKKLKVYRDRGKITVEEYDELVALMDAYELA